MTIHRVGAGRRTKRAWVREAEELSPFINIFSIMGSRPVHGSCKDLQTLMCLVQDKQKELHCLRTEGSFPSVVQFCFNTILFSFRPLGSQACSVYNRRCTKAQAETAGRPENRGISQKLAKNWGKDGRASLFDCKLKYFCAVSTYLRLNIAALRGFSIPGLRVSPAYDAEAQK